MKKSLWILPFVLLWAAPAAAHDPKVLDEFPHIQAFKNLRVFGNRPVALMGASPGGFGTVLAQNAWLPVLRTLRMRPWFGGRLMVSRVDRLLDDEGVLTNEATREALRDFLAGFVAFATDSR